MKWYQQKTTILKLDRCRTKTLMFHTHASFHRRPYLALLVSDESSHHFDNSILRNRSLVFFQNLEIRQVSDKSSHHPQQLTKTIHVSHRKNKHDLAYPPMPPISMLCNACAWWCELLSGKCPRSWLCKNRATLKFG